MNQPKLLLQWRGKSILDHVLAAWHQSRATRTIVVIRQDDLVLRELCAKHDVDCICPKTSPRDMKQSVQYAIEFIASQYHPIEDDAWLLAPADLPKLTFELIDSVIRRHRSDNSIIVPRFESRTGHPVLFPWSASQAVLKLGDNEGINRLVSHQAENGNIAYVEQPDSAAFDDIDTAEDFENL